MLNKTESPILNVLIQNDWVKPSEITKSIWDEEHTRKRDNLIRVSVYNMRKKLARYGVLILSKKGRGYSMVKREETLDRLRINGIISS